MQRCLTVGCFTISNHNNALSNQLSISSTALRLTELLQRNLGQSKLMTGGVARTACNRV